MIGVDALCFFEHGKMVIQCKNYDLGCQGNNLKECQELLYVIIGEEMENRGGTLEGIPVAPSKFYNILAPVDFYYTKEIKGVLYSFHYSVVSNPNPVLGSENNDRIEDYKLIQHPIFLGSQTVLVLSTFRQKHGLGLGNIFLSDYIDHRKQTKVAMKDLVTQLADNMSMNAWWSLKEAINEEIENINKENRESGVAKQWPLDRPKED